MRLVGARELPAELRVMWISDDRGDAGRLEVLIEQVLAGGVRAVQLREFAWSARQLAAFCERIRPSFDACGAQLLVNDRADLAAAGLAHGVHLGRRSLAPGLVRRFLPAPILVGCAAHDPDELAAAADARADYALLSPIYATTSKPGIAPLGVQRAMEWTARARLPVLWLGGIDRDNARAPRRHGAAGFAVRSALADAADVRECARQLVAAAGESLTA